MIGVLFRDNLHVGWTDFTDRPIWVIAHMPPFNHALSEHPQDWWLEQFGRVDPLEYFGEYPVYRSLNWQQAPLWVQNMWQASRQVHVFPINDLREHESTATYWCSPKIEGDVVIHSSLDGRELVERLGLQ